MRKLQEFPKTAIFGNVSTVLIVLGNVDFAYFCSLFCNMKFVEFSLHSVQLFWHMKRYTTVAFQFALTYNLEVEFVIIKCNVYDTVMIYLSKQSGTVAGGVEACRV